MFLVSLKHELSSERDLNPLTLIDQDRITVLYFIFCTKGIEKKNQIRINAFKQTVHFGYFQELDPMYRDGF